MILRFSLLLMCIRYRWKLVANFVTAYLEKKRKKKKKREKKYYYSLNRYKYKDIFYNVIHTFISFSFFTIVKFSIGSQNWNYLQVTYWKRSEVHTIPLLKPTFYDLQQKLCNFWTKVFYSPFFLEPSLT